MNNINPDNSDLRLWRRYNAPPPPPPAETIDDNDLAAYLDGTADEATADRIEVRMVSDEAFLVEVMQLRRMRQAPAAAIPESLLRRLKALAGRSAPAVISGPAQWWTDASAWWRRMSYAAAAAGVILACFAGYSLGQDAFEARHEAQGSAPAQVASTIEEIVNEPALDLPAANADSEDAARKGGRPL